MRPPTCYLQSQHFSTLAVNCPPMFDPPLSERNVCTKLITPAVEWAGWDIPSQVREEVSLIAGRGMVRGQLVARGKAIVHLVIDRGETPGGQQ